MVLHTGRDWGMFIRLSSELHWVVGTSIIKGVFLLLLRKGFTEGAMSFASII